DARVQGWLEQTRQALEGGPTPAFEATDALEPKDPDALTDDADGDAADDHAAAGDAAGPGATAGDDDAGLATEKVPTLASEPATDPTASPSDIPQLFPVEGPGAPADPHEAATPAVGT